VKLTLIHTFGFILGTLEILVITIRQKFFNHALPNYGVVEPTQLHRGGQPDASGLDELESKGIKTVIHLRARNLKNYKGKLKRFFIPFNPYQPKDKVVIEFLKVIGNQTHHPVFVHCFHGADRTGMLCAIYRIVIQKWDKEEAIEEMKKYGFHFWHKSLIDYIRNMDIESIKKEAGLIEAEECFLDAQSSFQSEDGKQKVEESLIDSLES
jgi:protein tyrosine phosphatase (PTP) superfamily phosphohydrolase (DUF442 family)